MMCMKMAGLISVATFLVSDPVWAQTTPPAATTVSAGYLAPNAVDILAILPPAPTKGEARYKADRAVFKETRRAKGTPRWDLATNDVKLAPVDLMKDFSCAAGIALTPETAPRTATLILRAARDTQVSSQTAKLYYKRQRPYLIDHGPVCQSPAELANSPDYPSGHTTYGWTWATLLAELMPDRATPILARGRAYGESRIVCGVHNQSAVDAGFITASATLAAVHASADFQADLAAARAELAALRRGGPNPQSPQCSVEAGLVAAPIARGR